MRVPLKTLIVSLFGLSSLILLARAAIGTNAVTSTLSGVAGAAEAAGAAASLVLASASAPSRRFEQRGAEAGRLLATGRAA